MRLSPEKTKFGTVSADKSIAIFDAKTAELIKHYPAAHSMGIYDIFWLNETTFLTASADNSVKQWTLESAEAVKTYETGLPRDTSRQFLALNYLASGSNLIAINLSGDFVSW